MERTRTGGEARERQQQAHQLEQALSRQLMALDAALLGVVQDLPSWPRDAQLLGIDRRLVALDGVITDPHTIFLPDAEGRIYAAPGASGSAAATPSAATSNLPCPATTPSGCTSTRRFVRS